MTLAAADGRSEKAFEHAEVGLDLPALPVFHNGPVVLEELTEKTTRPVTRRLSESAPLRRDDFQDAQLSVEELVMMFGVVADVAQ